MAFSAKVVKDSIGPNGIRIISVEATYPRVIHAEIMTHRDRARNAASSRAIPWKRLSKDELPKIREYEYSEGQISLKQYAMCMVPNCMFRMVVEDPFIPMSFDAEQRGMQSGGAIEDQERARTIWLSARDEAVDHADTLASMGVHKSIVNRIVEPWMWITTLMTATDWKNFFRLRCHPAAEKHFQRIAGMMRDAIKESKPQELRAGQWHLPYFDIQDGIEISRRGLQFIDPRVGQKISAGRCARLSYLTHDGRRDIAEDIRLCEQLINPPSAGLDDDVIHASPLEHVAEATDDIAIRSGPFRGWKQFRKEFPNENVIG